MAQPLTDGILIIRYLANFRGTILIQNAIGPDAVRTTPEEITDWLDQFTGQTGNSGGGGGGAAAAMSQQMPSLSDTINFNSAEDFRFGIAHFDAKPGSSVAVDHTADAESAERPVDPITSLRRNPTFVGLQQPWNKELLDQLFDDLPLFDV